MEYNIQTNYKNYITYNLINKLIENSYNLYRIKM